MEKRCPRCDIEHVRGSDMCPGRWVGETLAQRYYVEAVLGAGGMGAVYRARHVGLDAPVALKMLHRKFSGAIPILQRFQREAKAAAALQTHPGIVKVTDIGTTDDHCPFLVMELLEGYSFTDLFLREPRSIRRVCQLTIEVLETLAVAHDVGIIHRDLKPDNLFLVQKHGREQVKILDFGIARVRLEEEESGFTHTGEFFGSPHYVSPEQVSSFKDVDQRADIYSMGAILFNLLTGRPVVDGNRLTDVMMKVQRGDIQRSARALRPDVPEWLDAIVFKALALDPDDRFADVRLMAGALKEGLAEWSEPEATGNETLFDPHVLRGELSLSTLPEREGTSLRTGPDGIPLQPGLEATAAEAPDRTGRGASTGAGRTAAPPSISGGGTPSGTMSATEIAPVGLEGATEIAPVGLEGATEVTPGGPGRKAVAPLAGKGMTAVDPIKLPEKQERLGPAPGGAGEERYAGTGRSEVVPGGEQRPNVREENIPPVPGGDTPKTPAPGKAGGRPWWIPVGGVLVPAVVGLVLWSTREKPAEPAPTPGPVSVQASPAPEASPAAKAPQPPPGMVFIPGGTFSMGSSLEEITAAFEWCGKLTQGCRREIYEREQPIRQVTVSPFFLDAHEVSRAQLVEWLNAEKGKLEVKAGRQVMEGGVLLADLHPPYSGIQFKGGQFQLEPGSEQKPATQVSWNLADRFCRAQNRQLPTEAQWEFAARGPDGRRFPWGADEPTCEGVSFSRLPGGACPGGDLKAIGSSSQDRTPEGVFDLGGNISEWVVDGFAERYPACAAPCTDPVVPAADQRVMRGGNWSLPAVESRAAGRARSPVGTVSGNLGFRCAAPVTGG